MKRHVGIAVTIALLLSAAICHAENGRITGTVSCARSGFGVSVHPVIITQGKETLARTLTDRNGKFSMEFAFTQGNPLTIQCDITPGYLAAKGTVEPNTEVAISVMPRWATVLGIVSDRSTGQGLGDVPVRAGRGDKFLNDSWATVKTDATGVYMMKVLAFDNDDIAKPITDLWLSINEGRGANEALAAVRTGAVPLWAWPDPTRPTTVEVSLPAADAQGISLAEVVTVREAQQAATAAPGATTPAPTPTLAGAAGTAAPGAGMGTAAGMSPGVTVPAGAGTLSTATAAQLGPSELLITCPHCGKRVKLIIIPAE